MKGSIMRNNGIYFKRNFKICFLKHNQDWTNGAT